MHGDTPTSVKQHVRKSSKKLNVLVHEEVEAQIIGGVKCKLDDDLVGSGACTKKGRFKEGSLDEVMTDIPASSVAQNHRLK